MPVLLKHRLLPVCLLATSLAVPLTPGVPSGMAGLGGVKSGAPSDTVSKPTASVATLVVDGPTGKTLFTEGPVENRESPCSSFKIPLAVMGFESGILLSPTLPLWDFIEGTPVNTPFDKQSTTPESWLKNSVVWYSQELTRRLGSNRFQGFVEGFRYGNRDLRRGPKGESGLTHAWLMGSLAISPREQVVFLRSLVDRKLPASKEAQERAMAVVSTFDGAGGWKVHGKTGSGRPLDGAGNALPDRPQGWFVGWASNGGRQVVFARFERVALLTNGFWGGEVRSHLLSNLGLMVSNP